MKTRVMAASFRFLVGAFFWVHCVIAAQPPSLFQERAPLTRERRICINMGSKEETIGPYRPESSSVVVPIGVSAYKKIRKIKKKFQHQRAFQLVRTLRNNTVFVIQVDPSYRYTLELGFIDAGRDCKNGGSKMDISVGAGQTKHGLTPTKTAGCFSPYFVKFWGVKSDTWDRIFVRFNGQKLSNFATLCVEKSSHALPVMKGLLYVSADDQAEVFINGISILKSVGCAKFVSTEIELRYDDLIAVEALNESNHAALRVVFVVNSKRIFSTEDNGWKARNAFPTTDNSPAWTLPDYIDNDWPSARRSTSACSPENIMEEVKPIWMNEAKYPGKVYFRYRVTF